MAMPWEEFASPVVVDAKKVEPEPWKEFSPTVVAEEKKIESEKPQAIRDEDESIMPPLADSKDELPDENTPDWEPPEQKAFETTWDRTQPQRSPFVQYPTIRPEDIEGTDLGAGLKSIQTQLAGWLTGMVRGTLQTAVGSSEDVLATAVKPVMGPMAPLAEPMVRMYLKGLDRLIPGSKQKLTNLVVGKSTQDLQAKLAQPTDIEIEAEKDFKQNSIEALKAYGLPMKIAYESAGMAWRIAGTMLLAESAMGKGTAPGAATRIKETMGIGQTPFEKVAGLVKENTMKAGAKFAALMYTITPGTPEEKTKAAAVGFAFSVTPLIASGARSDGLAKLYTAAMNMGISAVSGSYNDTIEKARETAEALGEDWEKIGLAKQAKYWAASVVPQAVADVVMASGAKSVKAVEMAMRDKTIAAVMTMTGTKIPVTVTAKPMSREAINKQAQELLDRQPKEPAIIIEGEKPKAQVTTPVEIIPERPTGVSDLQQSLSEAKTHDIANAVIDIASESTKHWNDMQKLYWQKIRDGEVEPVKGSPKKADIVQALKDNWQPQTPLSPADVARTEPNYPPGYTDKWGGKVVKPSVVRLEEHAVPIKEAVNKSILGRESQAGFTPNAENPEAKTRAQVLNEGIDKALDHLRTLEFAPEEINDILDGMAKGKNKIEGVGKSAVEILKLAWAAETPEQAKAMINTARAAQGKPVFTDIAAKIRGGEPIPPKPTFSLKPQSRTELFDAMPSGIKKSPEGPQAIEDAINALPFELPADPEARANVKRTIVKNAYDIARARKEGRNGVEIAWEKTKAVLRSIDSARYWMNTIYNRTGDFKFLENDNLADRLAIQKEYEHHIETTRMLEQEGVPLDIIAHLRSNKTVDDAVKDVLGLDPIREENAKIVKEANKIINDDPRAKDIRKFISAIETSFRTTGAIETRSTQIIKFSNFWDKYGARLVEGEAGKGDKVALKNLQNMEKDMLPFRVNEQTGEAEHITRDKAIEAARIYKEKGIQALIDYESTQDYGSRRYYWPTEYKPEPESMSFTTENGLEVFDTDGMLGQKMRVPATEGTEKTRKLPTVTKEGVNRLDKSASTYNIWYRHMRNLKVQLHTYDLMNELGKSLNEHILDGTIGNEEAKLYALRLKNIWGKPQNVDVGTKVLLAANSLFWKTYFLSLGRIAWFGGRNVMQGSIFGTIHGQYNPLDVVGAYPKFLYNLSDKNSTLRTALATDFEQRINQSKAYFNEAMMLSAPGERQYAGMLMDAMSNFAGRTDTASRFFVYGPGYIITEGYANKLVQGKITQGKFENGLMFDTMSEGDARRVRGMMEKAKDANGRFTRTGLEPVIREIAGIKNANVNFLYRTSERAMLEQKTAWRPWLGIISYARGSADGLYWNGVKPLVDGIRMLKETGDLGNLRTVTYGARNILMQMLGYTVTSYVMSNLMGEKGDIEARKRGKTLPGQGMLGAISWTPLSPGVTRSFQIAKDVYNMAEAMTIIATGDTATLKKAMKITGTKLANDLLYMTLIGADLANIAESINNKAMISNVEALKYFFVDWGKGLPPGVDAHRTRAESFLHFIFQTDEFHDDREPWKKVSDSTVFGEAKRVGGNVRDKYKRMRVK